MAGVFRLVLISCVVALYGNAVPNRWKGWENIGERYPAQMTLMENGDRSTSGPAPLQRLPLECILAQHFDSVFRIANCHSNNAGLTSSSQSSPSGSAPALMNASDSLCVWRFRHAPLRTRHPDATSTDAAAATATSFPGTGGSPTLRCLRRLLYEVLTTDMSDRPSTVPPPHSVVTLTSQDFTSFPSLWPREALAYKAHLVALEHCGRSSVTAGPAERTQPQPQPGGSGSVTIAGADTATAATFAGSCAVVTDQQGWVAAADSGAMAGVLRRDYVDREGRMSASSRRTTGTAGAAAAAPLNASSQPSPTALPWGRMRCPSRSVESLNATTSATTTSATTTNSDCRSRLYSGRTAWLAHMRSGLSRLAAAQRQSQKPARQEAPTDKTQQEQQLQQLLTHWDVLALPSSCAGWALANLDRDPSPTGRQKTAHLASTATASSNSSNHNGTAFGAGGYPPPRRRSIAGCVLAFGPQAVSTLRRLSVVPPRGPTTSSMLLPLTNVPFYAKLALLARQGVLRLAVAAPTMRPEVWMSAEAAQDADGNGGDNGGGGGGAAAAVRRGQVAPGALPGSVPGGGLRRPFLMFTCAGDQARWHMWAHPNRNYDLIVAYYGNLPDGDPRITAGGAGGGLPDLVYRARGSKHQNMHRLHMLYPHLLPSYEAVAVWDDDLVMNADQISGLFDRFASLAGPPHAQEGLWMAQPSLANGSKVSHSVNMNHPALKMSYTSFVEVNAHMFRTDKLVQVMNSVSYTGELLGWGVDFAMVAVLGAAERERYAVLHDFQVFNPRNEQKAQGREILKLASNMARKQQWLEYQTRMGLPDLPQVAYRCVARDPQMPAQGYPRYCPEHRMGGTVGGGRRSHFT